MSGEQRVNVLNDEKNIRPMESSINQSMSDEDKIIWANRERKKDPGKTNAESFGVDVKRLEENKRSPIATSRLNCEWLSFKNRDQNFYTQASMMQNQTHCGKQWACSCMNLPTVVI
jgi:hypothetical protein